jgi:hypothetical protein
VSQKQPFFWKIIWCRNNFIHLPLDTRRFVKPAVREMIERCNFFDIPQKLFSIFENPFVSIE